jgi:Flp pilus assembly protein TadD
MRQAVASPRADARVRQNLALVLALEGKFAEAEQVSRRDMSAEAASANVRAIRQMIAQTDSWRDLQAGAKTKPAKAPASPAAAPLAPDRPAG